MYKIAIQNSEITECIKSYFKGKNVEITVFDDFQNFTNFDLIILNDYNGPIEGSFNKIINIHPSLLPAFEGENAIERAFSAGVKVSGVTVQSLKDGRIIAQYPVLIGVDTHIDEFIKDIVDIEKRLVPPAIESILEDTVFDFQDLFRNPCSHKGGCSGCGGCH